MPGEVVATAVSEQVVVGVISAGAVIFVAILGGLVSIFIDGRKANRKIDDLGTTLAQVHHQVFPNSGGSLSDQVAHLRVDIDRRSTEQKDDTRQIADSLAASTVDRRQQIARIHQRIDDILTRTPPTGGTH